MKDKIKVYLKTPLGISDSLYYKNLLDYPPENVEYKTNISSSGMIINKNRRKIFNYLKNLIKRILQITRIPILNIHKVNEEVDLIHCGHCIPRTDLPWVADFEAPWQFWISGRDTSLGKKKFLEVVSKDNCKKLLAWTNTAKEELIKEFPSIKHKVGVLPYAMPLIKSNKKSNGGITLLFVARYFFEKGGLDALRSIDALTNKYEKVDGIIVSDVPEKIKNKYSKNKKIKFYPLMKQKKLFDEIYSVSDIFIYPGYSDTFGFGFIEAMNFGLPIITVDGYARKDIVDHGKTGFVINLNKEYTWRELEFIEKEEIVEKIVEKTEKLILNSNLRIEFSNGAKKEIKQGKFSINRRNKIINNIYLETFL